MFGLLFAFALGVFPGQGATQVVKVTVRDEGLPRPFSFEIRTKAEKSDTTPWQYLPTESLQYFPTRLLTSPPGRTYTIRVPEGLKQYTQICAFSKPRESQAAVVATNKPADGPVQFSVSLSLRSCQNLPKGKT
jgi:hypothetical protein